MEGAIHPSPLPCIRPWFNDALEERNAACVKHLQRAIRANMEEEEAVSGKEISARTGSDHRMP